MMHRKQLCMIHKDITKIKTLGMDGLGVQLSHYSREQFKVS